MTNERDAAIAIEIADAALMLHGLPTYTDAIKALNLLLCQRPGDGIEPGTFAFWSINEACRVANGSKS